MIIPIELRFKADKNSKSAFRTDKTIKSHDVNSVEFHISIDGLELTDNHTAKILSIFHSSKSQVNVDCEIVEGKIIYKPDTNLISRHEHVTNYVYVYKNNQSLDVREFIYIVDLSKIDETSLEVKEVYDQSYADLLADFEQALSDYKDSLPQADSVRAEIDEILNQFEVDSQAKLSQYDTDAQQVIADNQTAFNLAQSVRQEDFDTSQSEKQQRFDDAQSARQESYDQTQSLINEAEEARVQAEGQRVSAESSRVSAESDRVSAESSRVSAESIRVGAESERVLAEDEREAAETQRKADHANRSAELAGKADKVVLKNLIRNGDFSDGMVNLTLSQGARIENQKLVYAHGTSGSTIRWAAKRLNTDFYYLYLKYNTNETSDAYKLSNNQGSVFSINSSSTFCSDLRTYPNAPILSIYGGQSTTHDLVVDYYMLLNLTEAFGAGNEPTKEEMDRLIENTGYIDRENGVNVNEMLGYLINNKANKKQEDWITPTLLNGWTTVPNYSEPGYMKDEFGFVHVKGTVKGGAGPVFQLPLGYRPPKAITFPIVGLDLVARAILDNAGNIIPYGSIREWVAIQISFKP